MRSIRCLAGIAGALVCASAHAEVIQLGEYVLGNHPDGNAQPPQYGLRLDELFNVTSGHDIFSFDFEAIGSDMQMIVTASTIRIFGTTLGGRDVGGSYAVEATTGFYTVDFLYNVGVATVPGDDDVWVKSTPDMQNRGKITAPGGQVIDLVDKSDGNYQFRLGDEDNDAGHRGFDGISGWGWLNHGPSGSPHIAASDFLFTARFVRVPAPGAIALVGVAGLAATRRRR